MLCLFIRKWFTIVIVSHVLFLFRVLAWRESLETNQQLQKVAVVGTVEMIETECKGNTEKEVTDHDTQTYDV